MTRDHELIFGVAHGCVAGILFAVGAWAKAAGVLIVGLLLVAGARRYD